MKTAKLQLTILAVSVLAVFSFAVAQPVQAVNLQIVPECAKVVRTEDGKSSTPSLNCALQTFGNIANLILGITGSLALLMFVYGGFKMITAAGEGGKVDEGKTVIKNAVVGIIIIMTSGIVINYGLTQLKVKPNSVIGQPCANGGITALLPSGAVECVTTCSSKLGANYACIDPAKGMNCIIGICPGGTGNVCCQPASNPSP